MLEVDPRMDLWPEKGSYGTFRTDFQAFFVIEGTLSGQSRDEGHH